MRFLLIGALALALAAPVALSARTPQADYMVHMDLSGEVPKFIPNELTLLPGGVVQLMLFGKGAAHSLTLAEPGYDADVAPGVADGYYERVAEFRGPTTPGTYAFHDKYSAAKGTLIVASADAPTPVIAVREQGYSLYFEPERLEVPAGSSVTFRANGTFAHTLTSETQAWDDSTLRLSPGQAATFTAPTSPGEYAYYCLYHKAGGMVGILVVTAASPVEPAPEQAVANTPTNDAPAPGAFVIILALGAAAFILAGRARSRR